MRTRICTCRRAVALMLAMIAVIVAGTVGYSYLAAQSTSIAIAQNIDDAARARYVAETGMEVALSYVKNTSNWRSAEPNGIWASNISFGGGTYSIRGEDGIDANGDGVITTPTEGDGNLTDNASDPATITVTATTGGASCRVSSVISGGSGGSGGTDYGNKTVSGTHGDDADGMQIASRISITTGGTLTSLSYYGNGPSSKNFRLALYADTGGQPGSLMAQTDATDVGSQTAAWHTVPVTTPISVNAGTYWVALSVEHRNMDVYYSGSSDVRAKSGDAVGPGFSSSWGSSFVSFPAALNVHATVSSAGVSVDWKN